MSGTTHKENDSPAALATGIFHKYAADLHRFLRKRMSNPDNAEDVFQGVFARLVRVKREDLVRKPHAYLYGIAFHVVREWWIKDERDRLISYDSRAVEHADRIPEHAVPDEAAERLNLQCQLDKALAELPEIHRIVLLLCKRDGMTYEEASRVSGISAHMVEKYLTQARAKIMAMSWDR